MLYSLVFEKFYFDRKNLNTPTPDKGGLKVLFCEEDLDGRLLL
jgi:hypothetical protein